MLGALLVQLTVLAFSAGFIQLSLRRDPEGGLFAALPLGLLPPLALSALLFAEIHVGTPSPEMLQVRADWMARWSEMAKTAKHLNDAHKAELLEFGENIFGLMPAFYFSFLAGVLGFLAAWMRQRLSRLGLAARPEPLSQWMAPFALVWLVLGPVFWIFGGQRGVLHGAPWSMPLAKNLLAVGLLLYLFQGVVILGAKLLGWSREPGTRALTPLVLAALVASLLLINGQGLLVFLVLIGLFDPWVDLRRLQAPPKDPGATV
jgi:hypothetical protein